MRAHETQITVDGDFYALSNEIGARILGREFYTQLAGPRAQHDREAQHDQEAQHGPEDGYERDLFAR
jgi:N-acetyl-1-D-myo-inositol-2-amino-2-deoxy-alpha-D-glucopyranoside deacetylase